MLGHIDHVFLNGDNLNIQGWAIDPSGAAEGFFLSCGGKELGFIQNNPQESPDIEAAYPLLDESPRCRFSIDFKSELIDSADRVIVLKPVFKNGTSKNLFGPIQGREFPGLNEEVLQTVGGGNPMDISMEFLNHFVDIGGLQPQHRVLDVGCGFGRMALGLTQYLNPQTKYEGFDVSEPLIQWGKNHISTTHPHFSFQWLNIFNGLYNPKGTVLDFQLRFPYENQSFDFIILASVFTQMLPAGAKNYLKEMNRVLVSGGRVFVSLFLVNKDSQLLMDEGRAQQQLPYFRNDHSIANEENPDANVGYNENAFFEWCEAAGFKVVKKVYGHWCGRQGLSFQDFVVLEK